MIVMMIESLLGDDYDDGADDDDGDQHLADELGVVNDVELLPSEQLLPTDKAGEAFQVENLKLEEMKSEKEKCHISTEYYKDLDPIQVSSSQSSWQS